MPTTVNARKFLIFEFIAKRFGLLSLLLYFLFLSLTAIFLIPPTWDEYLDFSGCVGAANHLLAALSGHPTDIITITHDLEWYGNAYRWPAYILWALTSGFPVRIPEGIDSYDQFLSSSFSSSMHVVAALYSAIAILLYAKILRQLSVSKLLCLFSICTLALSPFWLANSFWNLKDLPVSVPILAVLYWSINKRNAKHNKLFKSLGVAALLGTVLANKYAYAPLVFATALIYSYSTVCSHGSVRSSCVDRSRLTKSGILLLFVLVASFVFSTVLTPQIIGNPLYPVSAIRYFASHALIQFDHHLSAQFFLSRASYLLTPALALLVSLGLIGAVSYLLLRLSTKRFLFDFDSNRSIVHLFSLLSMSLYIIPISISGRVFYGPDLRHLIWLYPLILLSLTLIVDRFTNMVPYKTKRFVRLSLVGSLLLTVIEVIAIYPHYNSYLGISPVPSGELIEQKRLVISKYNPYSAPEVQAQMLVECALNRVCAPYLSHSASSNHTAISGLTFPMNPAFVSAYSRLGENARHFPIFNFLGYRFFSGDAGSSCVYLSYSRTLIPFYSIGRICEK